MKKKILLSTIPALMLLGSCAGAQPKVESNLFLEDTLAHEEIFGGVEEAFEKAPRNTVDPYPESASPKIAIQTKDNGDDTVSIRFIAAVNIADKDLASSTAVWNRALFAPNGDAFREPADKPCKVAYSKLTEGESVIEAGEGDFTGYNRFVVYSMLNIPVGEEDPDNDVVDDYSKYCFRVRLTVNETPTDDYYASTVDLTKRVSFAANKTGTFMKGTFNGVPNTIVDADEFTRGTNNYATFSYDFYADSEDAANSDSFYIIRNVSGDFRVLGWDNWLGGTTNFAKNASNTQIQPKYSDRYIIYCANTGGLYVSDSQYILYINGTKTGLDATTPSGWTDKADFVVNAPASSTLVIKKGEEEYSTTIVNAGYYRVGLKNDSTVWTSYIEMPYICGSWNGWGEAMKDSQYMLSNVNEREFSIDIEIEAGESFKVATKGDNKWYGVNGESSENISIGQKGTYRIHFYPIPSGNNTFVWCESL